MNFIFEHIPKRINISFDYGIKILFHIFLPVHILVFDPSEHNVVAIIYA